MSPRRVRRVAQLLGPLRGVKLLGKLENVQRCGVGVLCVLFVKILIVRNRCQCAGSQFVIYGNRFLILMTPEIVAVVCRCDIRTSIVRRAVETVTTTWLSSAWGRWYSICRKYRLTKCYKLRRRH